MNDESNLERLRDLSTRLTDIEGQLTRANSILSAIVENSGEAILAKDPDGILTAWNPAAEKLYGWSEEEVLGKSVDIILPDEEKARLHEVYKVVERGESVHIDTVRVHKDGHKIPVKMTISPIRSSDGKVIGESSIARPGYWA